MTLTSDDEAALHDDQYSNDSDPSSESSVGYVDESDSESEAEHKMDVIASKK